MRRRNLLYLYVSIFLLASAGVRAQAPSSARRDSLVMKDTLIESSFLIEHKPLRAGIQINYGWGDYYEATIPAPIALIGCDEYSMGTGNDYGFRFLADMPLWGDNDPWSFQPSLFLQYHHPEFNWTESDLSYDAVNHTLTPFSIRHELLATIGEAGIGGGFYYEFAKRWHAIAGANVGMLFLQSYQTSLHVVEPGNELNDGTRDTTTGSGNFPKKFALVPALSLGMNYDAPLSKKLWAEPGFGVTMPFGGQAGGGTSLFRLGGMQVIGER